MQAADHDTMAEDLALLTSAAEAAADIALGFFRQDPKVWHKDNASPVSEADYAVDSFLKDRLLAARPDYGWLSEETEDDSGRLERRRVFVVDPIDGTRGFLAGSDEWTISLAVVEKGRPDTAVLIQPTRAHVFFATAGGGAWLNRRPLAMERHVGIHRAKVAGPAALLTRLRHKLGPMPDGGYVASLALRIAMVADGRLDLALAKPNAHDWDIAAADLVLAEAGGRLLDVTGTPILYNRPHPRHGALVAAHPVLAAEAVGLIADAEKADHTAS
ncbi:3'(2'),5'-bisphosphate nucleotidase CysQ [Chthonobacter albigriseus]|uniref:3'(2'),5'-bisphosphate nucleotidase CysQ n=1 Tax=Chthonobacter albigriseus TaxID=1683161 RepID=UPI001FCE6368|nr:3'(2'),5'-bisphosphate nucleotidase CysQ [Chthonobacter albigriseus]